MLEECCMNYEYLEGWKKRAYAKTEGRGRGLKFLIEKPVAKNDMVIDLHIHSVNSDGVRTLEMIGKDASANQIKKLAFADHDTIRPLTNLKAGKSDMSHFAGEVLTGVEITSKLDGDTVEVLVYDFDLGKAEDIINSNKFPFLKREFKLKKFVDLISKRIEIVNKLGLTDKPLSINDFIEAEIVRDDGLVKKATISSLNMDISKAMQLASLEGKVVEFININKQKTHLNFDNFNSKLYRYISACEKGQQFLKEYKAGNKASIENFSDFNRYLILKQNSPLYVDDSEYYPTVQQVCDFAKETGGVALFAHLYGYGSLKTSPEELMQKALKSGVDGFECMHGYNEPDQIEKIYKFCYEHDLLISAGSDVHEFYSTQGKETSPGMFAGKGIFSKFENNILDDAKISTYNLHHVGSGAWRGEKEFNIDSQFQPGM